MHTVCDIPDTYDSVRKEYLSLIPHADLSFIDKEQRYTNKNLWYYYDLQKPVRSKLI